MPVASNGCLYDTGVVRIDAFLGRDFPGSCIPPVRCCQRLQVIPEVGGVVSGHGASIIRLMGGKAAGRFSSKLTKVSDMKKLAIVAALTAASVSSAWAVGGPLTFVGNTASFSSSVSGTFNDVWTFNVVAPGANAAASVTNVSIFGTGGITGFMGTLASVPLISSSVPNPPVVVSVLAGFTGFLVPGAYTLTIGGTAGAGGASYGGNLVLTPIPEPETYALMLAGLGIVGFMAARRRNRV